MQLKDTIAKVVEAVRTQSTNTITGDDMCQLLKMVKINDVYSNLRGVEQGMSDQHK